jgi:hypothetical protein
VTAGDGWWNQAFPAQTSSLRVTFDATPSASRLDAVVGLGDGLVSAFADLAAIVRFNPDGMIDVRSGASYRADVMQPYAAGGHYHVVLDIDIPTHTYSMRLRVPGGSVLLANHYSFRTEQLGVTRLDHVASKVDSSTGSIELSGIEVEARPVLARDCLMVAAGDGFVSMPMQRQTVFGTYSFSARSSLPDIDAVFGLSAKRPATFSDLAASVRFAPGGLIDARDGDVYRADSQTSYSTRDHQVEIVADLTSHTYSVFDFFEIARQYGFRTQQRAVTQLAWLSVNVDSPEGSVTICDIFQHVPDDVAYSREGVYTVVPLAGGEALLGDGMTLSRVGPAGQNLARLATGGRFAADALGNVFVAVVEGTTLTIDKLDLGLVRRWRTSQPVPAGAAIRAIATDAAGGIVLAVMAAGQLQATVLRITAEGALACTYEAPVEDAVLALDGDELIAASSGDPVTVTRFGATGEIRWRRAYTGRADIAVVTVDPRHNVLLGGTLVSSVDFGGGPLPLLRNPDHRTPGFVVKLSATGEHVFSIANRMSSVGGIASTGDRVAVSGAEFVQFEHLRFQLYDAAGALLAAEPDPGFLSDTGGGDGIAMDASGRIWWNLHARRFPPYPDKFYLLALDL